MSCELLALDQVAAAALIPNKSHQMLVGVLLQGIDLVLVLLHSCFRRTKRVLARETFSLASVLVADLIRMV